MNLLANGKIHAWTDGRRKILPTRQEETDVLLT